MSFLQLTPNPTRKQDQPVEAGSDAAVPGSQDLKPLKLRTTRFGELEEHELIHLIDTLDDERSRARFRESVYISVLVWIVIAWFLFYGPRILFHQPVLRDPIALMKQHDKERLTYLNQPPPQPHRPPVLNQKTIQQIQKQVQAAPRPQPQPPLPQPAAPPPPPQEQAHTTAPPVPQPALPLPPAPRPSPSVDLPSAPQPKIVPNTQSAHNALQEAMRGALTGRSGADVSGGGAAGGELHSGSQILSDTQGVDFTAYMRKFNHDVPRNWEPLIPEEVAPPLSKRGVVVIRITLLHDGQIANMVLESGSGDVALDKAAWGAITSEGQFPPMPKEFHGQQLEFRLTFLYNIPDHQ